MLLYQCLQLPAKKQWGEGGISCCVYYSVLCGVTDETCWTSTPWCRFPFPINYNQSISFLLQSLFPLLYKQTKSDRVQTLSSLAPPSLVGWPCPTGRKGPWAPNPKPKHQIRCSLRCLCSLGNVIAVAQKKFRRALLCGVNSAVRHHKPGQKDQLF